MSSYYIVRVDTYVSVLLSNQTFTNLINRVLGPYCKLLTEFFPLSTYDRSAKCAGHESNGKKTRIRVLQQRPGILISLPCVERLRLCRTASND